ncbi:response regulator [Chitinimonas sp. BJB300]|uniref:response regulator n=1 Tax=Chitinimonas sp. BJB300 TaxID=1559339 RepID=UPI000C0EB4D5|nr:response regulator [Chitinimonas sp. BJB300]PHV11248.1 response regulator [Chitinimonas sp. BJB300]TSJ88605.1 response regulator [Chitinimonas sp. BJB300]
MQSLLLLDDEPNILKSLRRTLSRLEDEKGEAIPLEIDCFEDPIAALKAAETKTYAAVISDYRMPQMNGVEFLLFFRTKQPDAVRIILSGFSDVSGMIAAINDAQIFRFLAKPWHEGELMYTLLQGFATRQLLLENRRLADIVRSERALISKHEALLAKLEAETPGITKVSWGPNGELLLDED